MHPLKTLGQIAFEAFWKRFDEENPKGRIDWEHTSENTRKDFETCAVAIIEEAGRRIENQIKKGRY